MKKNLIFSLFIFLSLPAAADELDFLFKTNTRYSNVLVEEVRAVNRFVIYNSNNKKEIIRLIGVKGPEKKNRRRKAPVERDEFGFRIKPDLTPETPMKEQAFDYVLGLLDQKRVRLEFDRDKIDDDFNTLAYVFLVDGGTFVNAAILRKGFAQIQIHPPNTKYKTELRAAYRESRDELRGFHGE